MCINAFPVLSSQFRERRSQPYAGNPSISIEDQVPRLNIELACEAAVNGLYAMGEIAAQFGNKASGGIYPATFNNLRKKIERDATFVDLGSAIGDLQWYRKVREIRTEWTHYSSIFIGADAKNEPLIVVESKRRDNDKQEFKDRVHLGTGDLSIWLSNATRTIDLYGDFLFHRHMLHSFQMDSVFATPVRDSKGVPIMKSDGRLEVEKITVREYLKRFGLP
jgi:hypothetical protein